MMRAVWWLVALLMVGPAGAQTNRYDVVLAGGRVMDPESALDAVRNVGIRDGRITAISTEPLQGKTVIDAKGYVVAPGFIDMHSHGQSNEANEYQMHDGVTTALELEWGVPFVQDWIRRRSGNSRINFGVTVNHGGLRTTVMRQFKDNATDGRQTTELAGSALAMRGRYKPLTLPEEFSELAAVLERGLREGALGIGMAHQYYPGATPAEIFRVFQMAARWKVTIFTHVRSMGMEGVQEVIADAAATGAAVHIVHINSSSLGSLPENLELIESAARNGVDVTTEAYPYTAASSSIQSTLFDEGWQQRLGMTYGDIQWQDTGERLTQQTFEAYRKKGGIVIMHMMKPEWIDQAMANPSVLIASDGMPYAPGAHPRSAGTFSRVLGLYVRERRKLTLMDALAKMTLRPARRLESIAPAMKNKGRVRVGADADITVFDPASVRDTATFSSGLRFSEGIRDVLVNGVFVVRNGKTVDGALPGRSVTGNYGQR